MSRVTISFNYYLIADKIFLESISHRLSPCIRRNERVTPFYYSFNDDKRTRQTKGSFRLVHFLNIQMWMVHILLFIYSEWKFSFVFRHTTECVKCKVCKMPSVKSLQTFKMDLNKIVGAIKWASKEILKGLELSVAKYGLVGFIPKAHSTSMKKCRYFNKKKTNIETSAYIQFKGFILFSYSVFFFFVLLILRASKQFDVTGMHNI